MVLFYGVLTFFFLTTFLSSFFFDLPFLLQGTDTYSNKKVAVKKIRTETGSEGIASTELREISILKNAKHPNVVQMLDVVTYAHKLLLIFECCDSDLRQVIKRGEIRGRRLKSFMHQLLKGLAYCHSHRIIHRDLKPQNLLVQDEMLKIADFGLARTFQVFLFYFFNNCMSVLYSGRFTAPTPFSL